MKSGPEFWPLYIAYGRYSGVAIERGSTVFCLTGSSVRMFLRYTIKQIVSEVYHVGPVYDLTYGFLQVKHRNHAHMHNHRHT